MRIATPKPGYLLPFTAATVNAVYRSGGVWWADVGRGAARLAVPRRKVTIRGRR